MAERLPILHIVGTPSTSLQQAGAILHHTLGEGNFTGFSEMSGKISATVGKLGKGMALTEEVDRVLTVALIQVGLKPRMTRSYFHDYPSFFHLLTSTILLVYMVLFLSIQCRPVYLALPTDLVHSKVSAKGLETPLVSVFLASWLTTLLQRGLTCFPIPFALLPLL